MAEILSSSNVEPGFYSQVRENANLQLPPNTLNIVALIGVGKGTQTVSATITPGLTAGVRIYNYDVMPNPVESFTSFDDRTAYPSYYGFGQIGSIGDTGGFDFASPKILNIDVSGQTFSVSISGVTTAADVAAAINGVTGLGSTGAAQGIVITESSLKYVAVISNNGAELEVLAGTANAELGYGATAGNILYWHSQGPTSSYQVTFEAPRTDYSPKYYYSANAVYADCGRPTATNMLSLGARGVFEENSNSGVVLARVLNPNTVAQGATQTMAELSAALADIEKYNCNIVVPMLPFNTYPEVATNALAHVSDMSNKFNRKERITILGVDETTSIMDTMGVTGSWEALMAPFKTLNPASGLKTNRMIVMNPGMVTVDGIEVNGTYLAACLAGRLVNTTYDEATPMTRKPFTSVAALYATALEEKGRTEKNALSGSYGVTVVEMQGGLAVIRRAVTANITSIASQEISIVRSFDRIAYDLRALLEAEFIGTKISPSTGAFVASSTSRYLNGMVNSAIIGAFRSVAATQNASDPRQFDVSFEAVPIYPFLWGFIDISITLQ